MKVKVKKQQLASRQSLTLATPTDLDSNATREISAALSVVLADVFAMYLKTKNFHWHMSGPHFRDYHLMLDEQAAELYAMTDLLAERCRKLGGTTLRSIGHISRTQRIVDNDAEFVTPMEMLSELCVDNQFLVASLRKVHATCQAYNDIASTSQIEPWIDAGERRAWFLFETTRRSG